MNFQTSQEIFVCDGLIYLFSHIAVAPPKVVEIHEFIKFFSMKMTEDTRQSSAPTI